MNDEFKKFSQIVEKSLKKRGNITITLLHLSNMLNLAKRQCEEEKEEKQNEQRI